MYKNSNHNSSNKKIYIWKNPKKLLNKYFFYDKDYEEVNMLFNLIRGIPILIFNFFLKRNLLVDFYQKLPIAKNLKQYLINIYSLIFFSVGINKYSRSIFIIGDPQNILNKSLIQVIETKANIEVWIIYQGTGSIKKKLEAHYSRNIKRVYFPFSNESEFENNLLNQQYLLNNNIDFFNIDTTLNLNISISNKKIAIFYGYDKKKKLFPISILLIIKELMILFSLNEFKYFSNIDIFLHPRLNSLLLLNLIKFNKRLSLKLYDDRSFYSYSYIISYSPTINSSISKITKKNPNYVNDIGINCNKKNIRKHIKNFKKLF